MDVHLLSMWRTSQVWMGILKNYLIRFVVPNGLTLRFLVKRLRRLWPNSTLFVGVSSII